MRQPFRARALFIVSFALLFVPGPVRAQETGGGDRTMSAVRLPGGLAAARTALGETGTADATTLLLDLIRRSFQTPVGTKGLRREAVLRPLLDHLDRVAKSPGAAQSGDDIPLPLTPAFWTATVIGGRSTPETLVRDLLRSPVGSLVYCALLGLDPPTREWLASNPSLLTNLTERQSAAFLIAAPGIRIGDGTIRVPGGNAAAPVWQALVGRPVTEPVDFVRALISAETPIAYFYGSAAQLTPVQQRFLLSLDGRDAAARTSAGRKLFSVFERAALGWDIEERPFWRPSLDPVLLVSDLAAEADGTPRVPGSTAFWALAFGDGDADRDRAGLVDGPRVEFASLCEQVFTGGQAVVRGPYQQVLFASRRVERITSDNVRDAILAIRAVVQYPSLTGTLERAHITSIPVFAAAARRAASLAAIDDARRAAVTLAQYQGGIALVARARARGSIGDRLAVELVSELSSIEPDVRGDYGGKVFDWLMGAVAAGRSARAGPQITNGHGEAAESPLDADVLALVSGPHAPPTNVVQWEGTRYRIDPASGEIARLRRLLGESQGLTLSAAASVMAGAHVLEGPSLTRALLTGQAEAIEATLTAVSCESADRWHADDLSARCREIIGALTRAAKSGDIKGAARVVPRLKLLADSLLARGFLELTYAMSLGQPDVAAILATDAASRHEFGFDLPGFGRLGAWKRPAAGSDRVRDWHVTGSMLGLDVALATSSLARLSTRPPSTRPTLNDEDRRVLTETVPLMNLADLEPGDHRTLVAALKVGRERAAGLRSLRDVEAIAGPLSLTPTRITLLSWAVQHRRADVHLSPYELLLLGREAGAKPGDLDAWGVAAEPRLGCLCVQMPTPRQFDLFTGRWHTGVLATGFPDLNLRLAELLADLEMPGTLLPSVLAAATWDLVINVRSRDYDDRQGLVDFVDALTSDRVELYLALLTTDGPLVPILDGSGPRHGDGAR
jgi:hypothetical protein